VDVADERTQGEGHHFAHATEPNEGQQLRIGEHFLGDQAAPMRALFVGMAQFHEQPPDYPPWAGSPTLELAQLFRCGIAFGQGCASGNWTPLSLR
jgi:hypothetical protein